MTTKSEANKLFGLGSLLLVSVFLTGISTTSTAQVVPADPDTFLTFLEHFQPEDAVTAAAYYKAVDPLNKKTTAQAWAKAAGFIASELNYVRSGSLANPGDNEAKGKSYAFALYQNAADLGFIRRMFIRCVPDCVLSSSNLNPSVYSYVENYAFLTGTADPYSEAKSRTNRIATVAFDWTSAADGTNPNKKFGTIYTFNGDDLRVEAGTNVPFAPNLDGRGKKQQPGVCLACHGGFPKALVNGTYPSKGQIKGFKFLPFDLENFNYESNDPTAPLSRKQQEPAFKRFNEAVLLTHRGIRTLDNQGVLRFPAGKELIEGWYGGNLAPDTTTFNPNFVPPGWREARSGGSAPLDSENLYLTTIRPACRQCHVQQEPSLDFATQKGFIDYKDAVKELVLKVECGLASSHLTTRDDRRVMPLAQLTYERFWKDPSQVNTLKKYLGIPATAVCPAP